ncbi:pyridoxal phosphate-dependent decarboxylase family protein [Paracraurococcus ruber]|uniref:Aspartate aminotransferase family protein n=1 Tax=Paracraurococcus ruber TaxID=77675 RepID=A0ABS1D4G0_9PROT|nr:pyridoxal-dependent decarboxylase [Paracraurococcus ruber]MBK1660962.1 aspartate aminotransferase family protein [Paracraurococcus ruber]TDG26638.1 aspartate aminotransferase family protein [Paracraurococcus ruber]
MTPEEFRRFGHQLVDWVADYRAGLEAHPVQAPVAPGEIRAQLPASPPDQPEDMQAVLADLDRIVMPGITHWQSPRFFGYFPANAPLAGVLGDLVSTGLGVIGLSWQSGPAVTELEEVVTDWVRQMVGLSPAWSGVIQDTASTSTLVALLCARERSTGYAMARGGLQAEAAPLVVYVCAQSHSSVDKAALLAGFGRDQVRLVPFDDAYAMRADALAAMVEEDLARGWRPCAVVATTGTTATTAVDPVGAIAAVARRHGLWLHVDAAMAGSAMILPECRWMWDGIEAADSLVLNAHKWLGVPFDCSLYFVRDPQHLMRVMSTNPSFLQSSVDGQVKNLRDWGIPLGRRFRALKLWFVIREQGVEALRARLRRDMANARWLAEQVAAAPGWRVLAPVALQTVCLRHEPPGLEGAALDAHTTGWAERINRSGAAYLTPAVLDGRWMVRVSVGAETTEHAHVAALWDAMRRAAEGPG